MQADQDAERRFWTPEMFAVAEHLAMVRRGCHDSADEKPGRLAQQVATLRGLHRKCRVPACKRARACAGPDANCLREESRRRPVPVRVVARRLAAIRRAIRNGEAELQP